MLKTLSILVVALMLVTTGASAKKNKQSGKKIAPIEVKTPARPAGQQDVVGLTAPKLETVRVGFIGLGMRGPGAVDRFTHIDGVNIVALCDIRPECVEKCQKILEKAGMPRAAAYSGSEDAWKEMCNRDDIDLIYIATDWKHHAMMGGR